MAAVAFASSVAAGLFLLLEKRKEKTTPLGVQYREA